MLIYIFHHLIKTLQCYRMQDKRDRISWKETKKKKLMNSDSTVSEETLSYINCNQ